MRRPVRLVAPLAVAAALVVVPAGASAAVGTGPPTGTAPATGSAPAAGPVPDLPALQAELAALTTRAQDLSEQLAQAAAQDGGLRVAEERLADQREAAQARLDARVREVWMRTAPDPLGDLTRGLADARLQRLVQQGAAAAVRVDRGLVDAVTGETAEVVELRARAEAFRAGLHEQAGEVLVAQERARVLLAAGEAEVARQEAERRARDAADAEQARRVAAEQERLRVARTALDAVSRSVTVALSPAQTRRSQRAAVQEAPLVARVEAAGSGYPQGYAPTGQVLRGQASWYGPGFVGKPTASGAPYDPERLTCAHKTLPLGTVVRVSRGDRAISCLVNDRGPYVGTRIVDLSRAGSRALGFDGVADVVVEVLAPA